MIVEELIQKSGFCVINRGEHLSQVIAKPFCCDLLSIAMSKTPASSAWVTVMGNINTLAVASLTEAACVILAEGICLDEPAQEKARSEGLTVLGTTLPIFEAAMIVNNLINETA